jgi:membrane protein required for colicin V production
VTAFDFVVVGIVFLSLVFGFFRGFIRVMVALGAWVVAVIAAVRFSGNLGPLLPDFGESPATRYVLAFAVILIAILLLGAVLGWALARMVRAIGLGFVDRTLGAVVGIARGVVIVILGVLLAGLTALPRQVWWQNAVLAPPLVTAALSLRPWLPKPFADRLDFGGRERVPARATTRV